MLIDIKPDHEPSSNCIEDIFATLLKWKNKDCALIFSNSWSFNYKRTDREYALLGSRVDIYRNGFKQLEDSLEQHYGIKVGWKKIDDYKNIIEYAGEEIAKGKPLGISLDTFWCPWNSGYQKYHASHYCLVTGIQDKDLVCVDSYLSARRELLSLKDYSNCYDHYMTFSFEQTDNDEDWRKIVKDSVNKVLDKKVLSNDFDNMREFANEIKDYKSITNEFEGYDDIGFAPIIQRINNISYGRKNFTKVLLYFYNKNNILDLDDFPQKLNEAGLKWSKINNLILKYCVTGFSEDKLVNLHVKINEIADYEENLAKDILRFVKEYNRKVGAYHGQKRIF